MTMFCGECGYILKQKLFSKIYAEGINKKDYWLPVFDDTIVLLARLPRIAAYIYRKNIKTE